MATPARKMEADLMEERIARLETHTEHLREDVHRVEAKVDRLDGRMNSAGERLDSKIDHVEQRLLAKLDALKDSLTAFQLETKDNFAKLMKSRMADRVWWLLIAGALLGVMARGFKWI